MTAFTEFFCNVCNPSAQRREEGDELTTGYERVLDGGLPEHESVPPGWCSVKGLGPAEFGHVCDDCISKGRAPAIEYTPPSTLEKHDNGWPSRASPFGN